jgi:hypothetical protein
MRFRVHRGAKASAARKDACGAGDSHRGQVSPPFRAALLATLAIAVAGALLPAVATASLPDGRVYEQVSPANKNGNIAGVNVGDEPQGAIAAADGNSVLYGASGAIGVAVGSPLQIEPVVSRHYPGRGWETVAAKPRQVGSWSLLENRSSTLVPSEDLSYVLYTDKGSYVAGGEPADPDESSNIYLAGPGPAGEPTPDPFVEPAWLGRPAIVNPIPALGENTEARGIGYVADILPAGPPSDSGTAYFAYSGTLLPEDASRAPYVGNGLDEEIAPGVVHPWGFYEWHGGTLSSAGTLPADSLYPGEPDPWGAEPSALAGNLHIQSNMGLNAAIMPDSFGNEVSSDGSRALFVSPDPLSEHPANDPPELYVRVTAPDGTATPVLVSQDALLPELNGLPAPAPAGVTGRVRPQLDFSNRLLTSFAYATPDGSRVFFASTDRLTAQAPSDPNVKEYEFDLEAQGGRGEVSYLPGVTGPVLTVSPDGSRLLFENTAAPVPAIELWQRSASGEEAIKQIAQLPPPVATKTNSPTSGQCSGPCLLIPSAYASADGSVFAFETDSPLGGDLNNGGGFEQIYRYEASAEKLVCVSCPPRGALPSGNATFSNDLNPSEGGAAGWLDSRGISEDGSRVFFDSPDPLVAQDVNRQRDVYEWENGFTYLISDGTSDQPSFYLDSSASGGDVFFVTASGLVPGDRDGGYDVYDARVPQSGDNPPVAAVPCQGEVCQGPPSVPSLLGAPSSATFSGLGNIAQPPEAKPVVRSKQKPKKRKQKKLKKGKKAKRAKTRKGRGGR